MAAATWKRTWIYAGILFWLFSFPAASDVLFTHQIKSYDYMLGETDALMRVGYADQIKFSDKETRYQAGFLKRFFGKVKTGRTSSEFNLREDTVSEVDWENRYIYIYPLTRISDPEWHKKRTPFAEERTAFVKERYSVSPPRIAFEFKAEPETVNGYTTRRVDIRLDLETLDKKKNARSLTRITQSLWLSHGVEGFDLYTGFNQALSLRTGINHHRLGLMGNLLSNFPQDLTAIEQDLSKITGYAVKSRFLMEGSFVQNYQDKPPKTTTRTLKEETMELTQVQKTESLDKGLFLPPSSFARKTVD